MGEPLTFHFDSRKTAQALVFLLRLCGGKKSKGHLVKMLYGADKNQIRKTGIPITGDAPFSMKNGPVLSHVLDLLDGDKTDPIWAQHISTASRDDHLVHLLNEMGDELLTESERQSLLTAWKIFGPMSWNEVQVFCHDEKIFPEWKNPGNGCIPITFEELYSATGRTAEFAEEMRSREAEDALISQLAENAKHSSSDPA